jgi:hypothetical protein
MMTAINNGTNRFLKILVIFYWKNSEKIRDAIYDSKGVKAIGRGVGLVSVYLKPVT